MMTTNTEYAPYRLELVNITKRYGGWLPTITSR